MAQQSTANTSATTVYLVAIDGSPASEHVLEMACGLGAALGGAAELHIVHAVSDPTPVAIMAVGPFAAPESLIEAGRVILDRASAAAAPRFGGRIRGHLIAGDPSRGITQLASSLRADLVIVGTAGRTGLARLALGSVAETVVRNAGCPVLVARPKDFHVQAAPEIEPPCADCVSVQNASARTQLWCARHSGHHAHGRLHYEVPPSFALGTMLLRPDP